MASYSGVRNLVRPSSSQSCRMRSSLLLAAFVSFTPRFGPFCTWIRPPQCHCRLRYRATVLNTVKPVCRRDLLRWRTQLWVSSHPLLTTKSKLRHVDRSDGALVG